jgi:hypothetical protein
MTIRKLAWSLLLVALLLSFPALVVEAKGECSLATLNGTYGALDQGTVLGQLPGFPPPPFQVAITGIVTYDGAGNLSGTATGIFGGGITGGPVTGTYTVKPDCTYSDEFTPLPGLVLHHVGTISAGGILREIDYIYADAGVDIAGTAKKTPPGGCSLASLKGTYEILEQGLLPVPRLFAASGTHTYDGAGNLTGTSTASLGGTIVTGTHTGTYTVNPDCTYSHDLTVAPGVVLHHAGTITGGGIFREVQYIFTNPGTIAFGTTKKQ